MNLCTRFCGNTSAARARVVRLRLVCVCVCVFAFVAFAGVSVWVSVCVCCVVPFAFRSVASVVRRFVVEAPFLVASVARGPPSLQHVVFACLLLPRRRPL